jgi:DNA excision repair protein ERCC-2
MRKLAGPGAEPEEQDEASERAGELNLFPARAGRAGNSAHSPTGVKTQEARGGKSGISVSHELPEALNALLQGALAEAETWLALNQPAEFREDLLALYFRLHAFRRTAELYDEHYVTIIENVPSAKVRLFCLDPACLLRQALARGRAAIFFSATLTPIDYYQTLLGGMPEDPVLQLPSPFPPENLAVVIQDRIQTHFRGRAESLGDVVTAIGTFVQGRRGNYLIYFPSYQYLNAVICEFQARYPLVSVLVQRPGMNELERDAFLAAFAVEHGETLAGFAVLGGIFGEGIDLVGERLIGAVTVGVGLAQLCVERDLIRDYFQPRNAAGFDYAYTYPGMNRVLQAIGRVIRSETDRGAVLLIDARFSESRYRRLFPAWWRYVRARDSGRLQDVLSNFWEGGSNATFD